MKKYFVNVITLEELKKEYKKLAFKLHPDCGGNIQEFQNMSNEYQRLFDILRKKSTCKAEQKENSNMYKDIIDVLCKYEGLEIDIIGTWVWINANKQTYTIRNVLKSLKFFYSKARKKFYYNGQDGKQKGYYKKKNYNELKNTFGCTSFRTKGKEKPLLIN